MTYAGRKALTEVTSFFVEFARGNKAAAFTKVAAQAAAAVIDLSTTIFGLLLARTCKNTGRSDGSTQAVSVPDFILCNSNAVTRRIPTHCAPRDREQNPQLTA